ncbi:periplasmic binding protein-like I [Phycomyces nitens]|nr:periplasmic binding protein-like I [Phycomyces nitens]
MLINPAFGHGHSTQTPNAKTHSSYLQYDASNNFTFVVSHRNGSTFVSPFVTTNLTELRVGVLLPFHQTDNNSTMQITLSGASAIRMAATEINVRQLIPGAYITLVEKDSYPKEVEGQAAITQAVFSAVSLIQEGVIGLIGDISSSWTSLSALMTSTLQIPQCSFSAVATSLSDKTQYGYFFRTIPTDLLYVDAALSFITSQGWPTIGILYSSDDFGQQLSENTIMKARMRGITVKTYQSFYEDGPTSDIQHSIDTLMQSEARIIIIAAEGKALTTALTVAANSGYINDSSVWLMFGETSAPLIEAIDRFNRVIAQRIRAPDSIQTVVRYAGLTGLNQKTSQAVDPAEYAARVTTYIRPIDFNTTFSGGVFMFKSRMGLTGYPPFDEFMDKWSRLDPKM